MTLPDIIAFLEARLPGGIDPQRVEAIYAESLAEDLLDTSPDYLVVEGILRPTAFDLCKLKRHRDEIAAMLCWLPREFLNHEQGGGGGWSFLQACQDRHDRQWTGLHMRMDQLFQLGIALGMAQYLGPRELWKVMPGGMPYAMVTLPEEVLDGQEG